jgi:glycosyltransferase involved in cell wall biosynthesis
MKLLFLITEDWYFVSHRLSLAIAAKEKGYAVTVVTRVGAYGGLIRSMGMKLVPLDQSRHSIGIIKGLRTLIKLWRIYRAENPAIVHHVGIKPIIYGTLVCILCGKKRIINALAGLGFLFVSSSIKARLIRFLIVKIFRVILNRSSILILQNTDDHNYFLSNNLIDPAKVYLIRGVGVNTNVFFSAPERSGTPIVMLASRLIWDKGVREFVEAAGRLKMQGIEARFVLVGAPDTESRAAIPVEQLLAWKESSTIELWGHSKDIADDLRRAHIVCLPSYREGLPKVLLEAASCGKPIVTTNVPGCKDVVVDGENGILVPARDVNALARAIKDLLKSPDKRVAMGRVGRDMVCKDFCERSFIDQSLQIYERVAVRKLLFLVTEDWYFWSHRLPLARAAKAAGFNVAVMTRISNHENMIKSFGIKVLPLDLVRSSMNPVKELLSFLMIYRALKREGPDIVHNIALKPILYGSIAAKLAGCKRTVNTIAGLGSIFSSGSPGSTLLKLLINSFLKFIFKYSSSKVIVQNSYDRNYLIKNKIARESIVSLVRGSGVNMTEYFPVKKKANIPIVLLASRMIWDKGISDFVDAAVLLRAHVEARFVLVGDTDVENPSAIPLKQLKYWHQTGIVEWWGKRDDMPQVFSKCHIACLPTFYGEGVPKFLIEAAACGLPIVATDWPGCNEIVQSNRNGFLVPVKDPLSLSVAIQRLIKDPDMRDRMGNQSRLIAVNGFDEATVISQTLGTYRDF